MVVVISSSVKRDFASVVGFTVITRLLSYLRGCFVVVVIFSEAEPKIVTKG